MQKINKFVYDGTEREVLIVQETNEDIYGFDLKDWPEESKNLLKTTFRHFKKEKNKNFGKCRKNRSGKTKKIRNLKAGKEKMKISAVYKITNTVTKDFYIGSSKDVKHRWSVHKCPSEWRKHPNNSLYLDMQKYGIDKFDFQILAEVEPEQLKETEQQFIEKLQPVYNSNNAKGLNIERCKEYQKEYNKKYQQSDKGKKANRKSSNKYNNQFCLYKGETLILNTLAARFRKMGIEHPTLEAKKYLLEK